MREVIFLRTLSGYRSHFHVCGYTSDLKAHPYLCYDRIYRNCNAYSHADLNTYINTDTYINVNQHPGAPYCHTDANIYFNSDLHSFAKANFYHDADQRANTDTHSAGRRYAGLGERRRSDGLRASG